MATDRRRAARSKPASRSKHPLEYSLLYTATLCLLAAGAVMVYSASSAESLLTTGDSSYYLKRYLIFGAIGVALLHFLSRHGLKFVKDATPVILFGSLFLTVVVMVPGIGVSVNGAQRWLGAGPVQFQPSELLKLVLLVYAADLLARRADRMGDLQATFRPVMLMLALASTIVLLQGDLGSAIVLATIVLAVAFIGGTPLLPLGAAAGGLFVIGTAFVTSVPYRRERWLSFLDLAAHRGDSGFQVWQSLIGIASGGVPGTGLGAGRAKWGYLPESHTDFIFAVIAEELGLIGVIGVVGLFLVFLYLGVSTSLRAADRFSQLLAGGITAWIATQAIINIGGVTGMLPVTGLTLPFLSFGGTSLLVTMTAAGLLLGCARNSR